MSLFLFSQLQACLPKKNSASPEKDPTFDTISTQTGFQNNESLCYICVEMLATLGSQWHPECSIFARKMLQDATVPGSKGAQKGIRSTLEDHVWKIIRIYNACAQKSEGDDAGLNHVLGRGGGVY